MKAESQQDALSLPIDPQAVKETFGTESPEAANYHLDVLRHGLWKEKVFRETDCIPATLREMKPQNPVEAMLMAQMVMMHENTALLLNFSKQRQHLGCRNSARFEPCRSPGFWYPSGWLRVENSISLLS